MPNNITTVVPRLLAMGLGALRENAVTIRTVNRSYEAMAGQRGSTIEVPIPSAVAVTDVTPAATAPAGTDITPSVVAIPLDQWKEAAFHLTDQEQLQIMEGHLPLVAGEAVKSIVNTVDRYVLALGRKFYGVVGTAGTTPFGAGTTADATALRTILNKQLAGQDNRNVVVDPDAEGAALNLRAFQDGSWAGSYDAVIAGNLNNKLGFRWWMNQNVQTHTAGAGSGYVVNIGAGVAAGIKVIPVDTGTGALVEGDILSFAGHAQTYVVTAAYAGGSGNISIEPGLQVAVADNVAITKRASHVMNLAYHRDAIAFASRPLQAHGAGLGVVSSSAVDPVSGLALRLEVKHEHKRLRWSFDCLYGGNVIRRELGARLLG